MDPRLPHFTIFGGNLLYYISHSGVYDICLKTREGTVLPLGTEFCAIGLSTKDEPEGLFWLSTGDGQCRRWTPPTPVENSF